MRSFFTELGLVTPAAGPLWRRSGFAA
jgi:hypothetical protein